MKEIVVRQLGLFVACLLLAATSVCAQTQQGSISGKIIAKNKENISFATVLLKGTGYGGSTNEQGIYHIQAPAGEYTLVVSVLGYDPVERKITLHAGERLKQNVVLTSHNTELQEVGVVYNGLNRVNRSAYNAISV
ncbi:carboxypeptidase-like regulatory domain-containing protein, partial [Dialister hominis]|uniref:carboxypeptidase-like regulatory domain-containing protein n=1 Tax=Dialister hominis TaxID=2582419 RepID=UPI0040270D07